MKHLSFYLGLFSIFLCIACKSAPKTTFVNTNVDIQNKLYTVCVLTDITNLTVIEPEERVSAKHEILSKDYTYNPATTELTFNLPKDISYKLDELYFHIEGPAAFPAEFILNMYDSSKGEPAVFYNGKVAVKDEDYLFDKKSAHITFLKKVDADKSSYLLNWPNSNGLSSIGNKTEKYKTEYESLTEEWINTLLF